MEKVIVLDGVTEIGVSAFMACEKLKEINLPDGIVTISTSAFDMCTGLEEIVIPGTVTEIGDYAFCGCEALKSLELTTGIERIGEWAFTGSGLENVLYHGSARDWREMDIAEGNDMLIYAARVYEQLTVDFDLPDSLVSIEEEAFAGITDVVVSMPEGVRVAEDAFDPTVVFAD